VNVPCYIFQDDNTCQLRDNALRNSTPDSSSGLATDESILINTAKEQSPTCHLRTGQAGLPFHHVSASLKPSAVILKTNQGDLVCGTCSFYQLGSAGRHVSSTSAVWLASKQRLRRSRSRSQRHSLALRYSFGRTPCKRPSHQMYILININNNNNNTATY
jgi:hypothetical protein